MLQRDTERRSAGEALAESELRFVERAEDNAVVAATHFETRAARIEVDGLILQLRLVRPPDAVDGPRGGEISACRMKPKHKPCGVIRRRCGKTARGDRRDIGGVARHVQQPLELRRIDEINEVAAGWKRSQESGKRVAVFRQ